MSSQRQDPLSPDLPPWSKITSRPCSTLLSSPSSSTSSTRETCMCAHGCARPGAPYLPPFCGGRSISEMSSSTGSHKKKPSMPWPGIPITFKSSSYGSRRSSASLSASLVISPSSARTSVLCTSPLYWNLELISTHSK